MSQDVAAFLMWAAEPKMMARKSAGLTAVLFLAVLTVLLWFTNKKIWAPHKGAATPEPGRSASVRATAAPSAAPGASRGCSRSFRDASTSPALIETGDGGRWVMKFAGAGPGPVRAPHRVPRARHRPGLRRAGAGGAAGAPARGFPWMAGTDEFDAMLQRSYGWNLGIAFIPDARPATPADLAGLDPALVDAIARADAVLQNIDRTAGNPNLLVAGGPALGDRL